MGLTGIGKWVRYFRHIPPRKIFGKVFHGMKLRAIALYPNLLVHPWPIGSAFDGERLLEFALAYQCMGERFREAGLLEYGTFSVKGVRKDFGSLEAIRWDNAFPSEPEKLHWMHDLAFFSFAIELVRTDPERGIDTTARLTKTLETSHPISRGGVHFAWSPIALSLRIMGVATAAALARKNGLASDSPSLRQAAAHIAYCAALLDRTAERYLGYNHNAFAETALAVARCALGGGKDLRLRGRRAATSICRHVLADGMWAERSPTYHIHMLVLARGLLALDVVNGKSRTELQTVATDMQHALGVLVHSDGEIALFNDAAMEDSVAPSHVGWQRPPTERWLSLLPIGGYAQLRHDETSVIFDAGRMGPDDVIGHGHGDFLAVEVCWRGRRLLVDPGVASITGGYKRRLTRSATLHNGPGYEGLEPAEFFGTWRVGRRGAAGFTTDSVQSTNAGMTIEGWCDGYSSQARGQPLRRRVTLRSGSALEIRDSWPPTSTNLQRRVALLVPAQWAILRTSECSVVAQLDDIRVDINVSGGAIVDIAESQWHPRGPMEPQAAWLLVIHVHNGIPQSIISIT